jgi:hypothetical protein
MILSLIAAILLIVLMIKSFTSNNLTGSKELQISAGAIGGAGVVSIFADYFLVEAELKEDEARWKEMMNVMSHLKILIGIMLNILFLQKQYLRKL